MSENSVEKRPIPMFWGQGEGERARAEAPWTQSGLTLCLCKPLPLVGAFSQGFKMEIPAKTTSQVNATSHDEAFVSIIKKLGRVSSRTSLHTRARKS